MRGVLFSTGFLACVLAAPAIGQSNYAIVTGTIDDGTGALVPGVTVTANNNATGVVTTVISNESGAYNFASLAPGIYRISAGLPGFQTKTYTDVELGNGQRVRLNFTLALSTLNTAVEVTVPVDTLLATSSSSVGTVLSEERIQDLPAVGNNVLDLLRVLPGTRMADDGVNGTFAGLGAYYVNLTRDGIDSNAMARWGVSIQTSTAMNQDLIGEIRLVLAPVDAEMGRGNGQMQVFTKSGSNTYRGSAVWSIRNSALDANTWNNNNDIDFRTGEWSPTKANWTNRNEFTLSLGGPIIRNKTFFFALYDGMIVNSRTTQNPIVLTPCARNGIFRYFDNWNNGNAVQVTDLGTTPTTSVVDAAGQPKMPATNPNGSAFTGTLRYASVFGPLQNVPTQADCSDAIVQGNPWDSNRRAMDPTGFVNKVLDKMPAPNNYEVGDGLNTAGFRWLRSSSGGESIFGTGGDGLGRKQINVKIDHLFNSAHKMSGSYTYESSDGDANPMTWPDTFQGRVFRRPQHLSFNFTSTLSPTLVNEARVGMRRTGGNTFSPFTDPEFGEATQSFFPSLAGFPVFVGLGTGGVNFQGSIAGSTNTYRDITAMWAYGDTLSWTRGKHAFKLGGDIRRQHSWGFDAGINPTSIPRAVGGDLGTSLIPTAAISSTNIPGLAGTQGTGNNARMRNLLSFLAGSLSSISQFYYMQSTSRLDAFEDFRTFQGRIRDFHINEASIFVKDDWKMHKNLTLNIGLRWDYFGVPYESDGLITLPVGDRYAFLGRSGRSFSDWMRPGERAADTEFEFVGKNSPKPDKTWYPNDLNNFGPAVGFAWQVPWLGEVKTTVRGGYQVTYQIGEPFNALTQETIAPGNTLAATYTGDSSNPYLDLTRLPSFIPVPATVKPLERIPVNQRIQSLYSPDPDLVVPYVQNLTLAVTRSIRPNLTVDIRYLGVLVRKMRNYRNLNIPNFLDNGLKDAFDAVRRGEESALLDQMFNGINLAGNGFGPVGSVFNGVQQTAAIHMRASANFNSNLANGNYQALANTLNTLNYSTAFNPNLPPIAPFTNGAVLRNSRAFPENFIVTNPQFTAINYITNELSNNYHSMEAQITLRPTHGISVQSTYTWSKNLGAGAAALGNTFTNPTDRAPDYTLRADTRIHDLRTNGTVALPIGPNRLLLGNSSGVLARIVEGWQMSWIASMNTGAPLNISAQNMLYGAGVPDIVGPFDPRAGQVQFTTGPSGRYFDADTYKPVRDPQCSSVTTSQNLANLCTLTAIQNVTTGQIVLQNPLPGTRGTLGQRVVEGPGVWRFDASMSKEFKITESRSVQIRMDAKNVLNHPEPATPNFDINSSNFGLITGANAKSTLHREFQGQLRFNF